MSRVLLWKGYHDRQIRELVQECWYRDDLLILCPPNLSDFSFVPFLPKGEVHFVGQWEVRAEAPTGTHSIFYPDLPVLGVFTTGTTRERPKLVLYSRQNVESCIDGILSFFDRNRIEAIFCYPHPFHVFGLNLGYVMSLLKKYRMITGVGKYSASHHHLRASLTGKHLLTLGTPTHFQDLLTYVDTHGIKIKPTYSCIIGGSAVDSHLWKSVRDKLNIESPSIGYGCTEASPGVTHLPPGHEPKEDGEVGFPLPHVSVSVNGADEFEFQGPNLCLAVVENGKIEFPQKFIIRDSVIQREDGIYVYQGRGELNLNRGGEKFKFSHIESLIRNRFGLEIVCVSVPDSRLGEELGILAKSKTANESREAIYQCLRLELGREFNPNHFLAVVDFPINENSKVDRKQSAALIQSAIHV